MNMYVIIASVLGGIVGAFLAHIVVAYLGVLS